MAHKELICTDNYTLPKGDKGPQGKQGETGIQGGPGPQQIGPQGKAGGNKIDINLQQGDFPFVNINTASKKDLAYFIFPGTKIFSPKSWKIAYSILSQSAPVTLSVELGVIELDGSKSIIASFQDARQSPTAIYLIREISNFANLPEDPAICYISAGAVTLASAYEIKGYATEIRE